MVANEGAALLAARLAEVAQIKANAARQAAAQDAYTIEETVVESPVHAEPEIEDITVVQSLSDNALPESVILPLTPPPITPYFERFAAAAPQPEPEAAKPQACQAAAPAEGPKEIPVEDLVMGIASMVGAGASGVVALGSKAFGGLVKQGSALGSLVAGKLGCASCEDPNKSCEK